MHIDDFTKFVQMLNRFTAFIQYKNQSLGVDSDRLISFRDSSTYLGMNEDYKSRVAEESRKELHFRDWNESWIGSGKIANYASKAISKAENLVNINQQISFKNRLDQKNKQYNPNAERILFEIYRGNDEHAAFEHAIEVFGAKYDTIAFLFFIKDDTRFLPISPGNFDKSFKVLNIDFRTAFSCSWANYCGFISIIQEIQDIMNEILLLKAPARLIDAHSFAWIVREDEFVNWMPSYQENNRIERSTEISIQKIVEYSTNKMKTTVEVFERNAEVVRMTKALADGHCQLCNNPSPFKDRNGIPYLEVHHVIWLAHGGKDNLSNTVALCPNCHTKMHILDDPADVQILAGKLLNAGD